MLVAAACENFLHMAHPALELGLRVARIGASEPLKHLVALAGELAQVGGNKLVLRAEVPVEGHLVGRRRLGDGLDPHRPDPMAIEERARGSEDAFAGGNLWGPGGGRGNGSNHGLLNGLLTGVLPVSIAM